MAGGSYRMVGWVERSGPTLVFTDFWWGSLRSTPPYKFPTLRGGNYFSAIPSIQTWKRSLPHESKLIVR